ncbi:MAG: glycerate kinase [Alphaproteobacteria bacterium]|nr:glycerate kinase [Alphaproteobacteria bacterium]
MSRALLRRLFDAAIERATAPVCLPPHLPPPPKGRTMAIGAGKAAAAMAKVVEQHWQGPLEGLVVTRYGHGVPTRRIEVVEAAHPVPDAKGEEAARRMLEMVRDLGPDDLALCLISGGASALLALPAPGLTLEDKRTVTRSLLRAGATIHQINAVRKHLSAIKGGRLAMAAYPAETVTLAISDAPGDDLSVIGSGPTVPDPSTFADARAVLARFGIEPPPAIARHLDREAEESPKPGDDRFARARATIVARPADSLAAAAALAGEAGYAVEILGDALEGEARDLGTAHARLAMERAERGGRLCLISGGETTVTVRGQGKGGRNVEYLLGLALGLGGAAGISAIAGDSDGIDGTEDNAGAVADPTTLARGPDAAARLADNDAYSYFAALDDLVVTGPTRTNVNDFRAILIER